MSQSPFVIDFRQEDPYAALERWVAAGEAPRRAIAFVPESRQDEVARLQAACARRDITLFGAVFPATVVDDAFDHDRAWLLPLAPSLSALALAGLDGDPLAAAARLATAIEPCLAGASGTPTLLLVFDAQLPRIESILEALYVRLGTRVRYIGVNAGSETFRSIPCIFDNTRQVAMAALAAILPGDVPVMLDHGYVPAQESLLATSSENNRINSIDWRPAFEVYRELVHQHYAVDLTPENFYTYGVHFPFGILRATGEVLVRIPVQLEADGSIVCVGEVPANSVLVVLKAPEIASAGAVERIAASLASAAGNAALLTFYCAGRRMHFGEAAQDELCALHRLSGGDGLVGALSLGELGGGDWSYPLFHNAAIVCRPWSNV